MQQLDPAHERETLRAALAALPRRPKPGRGLLLQQLAAEARVSLQTARIWVDGKPVRPGMAYALAAATRHVLARITEVQAVA